MMNLGVRCIHCQSTGSVAAENEIEELVVVVTMLHSGRYNLYELAARKRLHFGPCLLDSRRVCAR